MGGSENDDTESVSSHDIHPTCGSCDCPPTAFYSLGCGLLLIGSLLFLIFCSEFVPAYAFENGFKKGTCTVISAVVLEDVCCESSVKDQDKCEKGYKYPCVHIEAVENGGDADRNLTLYDEYKSLAYESKTSKELKCSYFHCDSSSYRSRKNAAKSFLKKHDVGKKVTCYTKSDDAIITILSDASFGTLLFFSLILFIGGAGLILVTYIYMRVKARQEIAAQNKSIGSRLLLPRSPQDGSSRSSSGSVVGELRRSGLRKEAFTEKKATTRADISIEISKSAGKK